MTAAALDHRVETLHAARLTTADGAGLLARLAESGMVDKGQVVLLGLDAIRDRFEDRWPRKSELVWDAALLHIRRRLGPGDLAARVGEVDAVIAVGGGRERAQALGLAILQELLIFFLGEARASDLKLNAVAWVSGHELGCAPIDPASLAGVDPNAVFHHHAHAHAHPHAESPAFAAPPPPVSDPYMSQPSRAPPSWSSLSLAVGQGRPMSARFVVQSLIGLRLGLPVGLRIDAQLRDQFTSRPLDPALVGLTTTEALALDLASVDFARDLSNDTEQLLTPLSFETVSTSRGRGAVLTRAGAAIAETPVLEIIGVDAGTPEGRLIETVALTRKSCRAVIARVDLNGDVKAKLRALAGARLDGLSIDLAAWPAKEAVERLALFAALARGMASQLYAFSLPSHAALERAAALGFSHATLASGD